MKYNIQGNDYNFMKSYVKQSIFLQLILFSANGIYTMLTDKKMELMIFATGNIYRSTGTSSASQQDNQEIEVHHDADGQSNPNATV